MKEEVNQINTDVRLGMFEDLEEDCQENKGIFCDQIYSFIMKVIVKAQFA